MKLRECRIGLKVSVRDAQMLHESEAEIISQPWLQRKTYYVNTVNPDGRIQAIPISRLAPYTDILLHYSPPD